MAVSEVAFRTSVEAARGSSPQRKQGMFVDIEYTDNGIWARTTALIPGEGCISRWNTYLGQRRAAVADAMRHSHAVVSAISIASIARLSIKRIACPHLCLGEIDPWVCYCVPQVWKKRHGTAETGRGNRENRSRRKPPSRHQVWCWEI